jgi:CRISPR/Cas system Type II protein with McrA/HNH and RuvC-like nuclease domain
MCDMAGSNGEGREGSGQEDKPPAEVRLGEEVRDSSTQPQETGGITQRGLLDKLDQQQYRCALTGRGLTPATAALDHIAPKSVSKDDTIGNVHWVHTDVNRAKGTMDLSAFVQMCCEVADWTKRTGQA